jgi:hypothetical protein
VADAGQDQKLPISPDSILLDGSASSDPDGKIMRWEWKQISGPTETEINKKSQSKTSAHKLAAGIYLFELMVWDEPGLTDADTVEIQIESIATVNRPPVADAGSDQFLLVGNTTAKLDGSRSSDPDNNIVEYRWREIDPPTPVSFSNLNVILPELNGLVRGEYLVELTVKDAMGLSSSDTVKVTVDFPPEGCDSRNRDKIYVKLTFAGNFEGRYQTAVVAAGSKIYIAGGFIDNTVSSRVDIFDARSGMFTTAMLSAPRGELSAVATNSKVLFAGGYDGQDVVNRVDILELATSNWSTATLSEKRSYMATASVGDVAVFAGGVSKGPGVYGSGFETLATDIYNASTASWKSTRLPAREPLESLGICPTTWENKIYLAGGAHHFFAWDFGGGITNTINIYDVVQDKWTLANLPEQRGLMGGKAHNGKTYWVGGTGPLFGEHKLPSRTINILDHQTGLFTRECLSQPVIQPDIVARGSELIIFTTKSYHLYSSVPNGVETSTFDIYNTNTGTWKIAVLPVKIYDARMFNIDDRIFIVGGVVDGELSGKIWELEY